MFILINYLIYFGHDSIIYLSNEGVKSKYKVYNKLFVFNHDRIVYNNQRIAYNLK
jgi:hypothetical protein